MAWKGDKKGLVDYAKNPDSGNGVVSYDAWEGASYSSGSGGAATKTGGQSKGNEQKWKDRGSYPND